MPVYRKTLKAEVRVIVQTNKGISKRQFAMTLLELEQTINADSHLIKIIDGVHTKALLRLHLKDFE